MVNLKEYYIKISQKKQSLKSNINKVINFVLKEEKQINKRIYQQNFISNQRNYQRLECQMEQEKKAVLKNYVQKNGFEKVDKYEDKFHILIFETLMNQQDQIQDQNHIKQFNNLQKFLNLDNIDNYQEFYLMQQQVNKQEKSQESIDHNYEQISYLFKDTNEIYIEIQELLGNTDTLEDEFLQEMDSFLKNFNKLFEAKKLFSFAQNKKFQKYQDFLDQYIEFKDDFEGLKQIYINPNETYNQKDFESLKSSQHSVKKQKFEPIKSQESSLKKSNVSQKKNLQEEIKKFCDKERVFMKDKIEDLQQQLSKMHQENLLLKQKLKQEEIKNESLALRLTKVDSDIKYKDNQIDTFFKQISYHIKGKQTNDNQYIQPINLDFQKTLTNRKFTSQKYLSDNNQYKTFNKNPYYGEIRTSIKESKFQKQSQLYNSSLNNSVQEKPFNKFNNINQFKSRIQENQDFLNSLNSDINKILNRNRENTKLSSSIDKQRNFRASSLQSQKNFGLQDQKLKTIGRISTFDRKNDTGNVSLRSNSFNDKENISSFRNSNYQNFQNKFSQGIFQYRNQLKFYTYLQTSFQQTCIQKNLHII